MWRYGFMLLTLLVVGWAFYPSENAPAPAPMPDIHFKLPDGKPATLADFKGKTVIIHFWASWCPPCLPELPELVSLARAQPDKLIILAFSEDKTAADMHRFLKGKFKNLPANFIALWDENSTLARENFYSQTYPESYILGCDGALRDKIIGPATDWSKTIEKHLNACGFK